MGGGRIQNLGSSDEKSGAGAPGHMDWLMQHWHRETRIGRGRNKGMHVGWRCRAAEPPALLHLMVWWRLPPGEQSVAAAWGCQGALCGPHIRVCAFSRQEESCEESGH